MTRVPEAPPIARGPVSGEPAAVWRHGAMLIGLAGFAAMASPEQSVTNRVAQVASSTISSNATYRVRAGDTLERIARGHFTTSRKLQTANPGVDPKHLRIGLVLVVPVGDERPQPRLQAENAAVVKALALAPWAVQSGDTVQSLTKQFGVTTRQVQDANPTTDCGRLKAGQTLLIPGYGWGCYADSNSVFSATHRQLNITVELGNESGTPRLLSWQQEREQLWSLTYYAGSPGTQYTFDVIRKALINVRTRKVLADKVFHYQNLSGNGELPDQPEWTWTTNALIIRDTESGRGPVTIPMSGMK